MDKFTLNRKFIYSLATVVISCVFWRFMHFDAATLSAVINTLSLGFLGSEAVQAFAKKD